MKVHRSYVFCAGAWLAAAAALSCAVGCGKVARNHAANEPGGGAGASATDHAGASFAGGPSETDSGAGDETDGGEGGVLTLEPGSVGMRLLTRAQYHNTVSALVGVDATAPSLTDAVPSDSATISDLGPYFDLATQVTEQVFAASTLPPLLTCPAGSTDRACALSVIDTFGSRAFRTPLLPAQKAAFSKLYDNIIAGGDTHTVALKQVVRGLLVSLQFLYRVEFTSGAATNDPYPLDSYAMAARLSYLLWNTTPDDALLAAAANDELQTDAGLKAQLARFEQAPENLSGLAQNFAASWLGLDVLSQAGTPVALAQRDEVTRYFTGFFAPHVAFEQVLTTALPAPTDARVGLFGLSGVLVAASTPNRADISHRGAYLNDRILCVPTLSLAHGRYSQSSLERPDLETATAAPACQACHAVFDRLGYGLDHFDYDGTYRQKYATGHAIDSSGSLSSGEPFSDEASLAVALSARPEFKRCLAQQLSALPLGRELTEQDKPYLNELSAKVEQGAGLRELYEQMVLSTPFRYRRPTPQ